MWISLKLSNPIPLRLAESSIWIFLDKGYAFHLCYRRQPADLASQTVLGLETNEIYDRGWSDPDDKETIFTSMKRLSLALTCS